MTNSVEKTMRIGEVLKRRETGHSFGPKHFWLLDVLCGFVLYIPIMPTLYETMRLSTNEFHFNYNSSYNFYYRYVNDLQFQNLSKFAIIWGLAATLAAVICHLVFVHKYCKAMNCLAGDYNLRG